MLEIPDVMNFDKPIERLKPTIENEEKVKQAFGIELGKGVQAFQAACNCGQETSKALFISQHWLNDPLVIAAKDLYLKTVYNSEALLDADELAARLLEMAEERNASNTFYMLEGKDRLKALELYAKIRGYDKSNPINNNNFTFKQMIVKFVEPENKEKVIEHSSSELPNEEQLSNIKSPLKLKLVS